MKLPAAIAKDTYLHKYTQKERERERARYEKHFQVVSCKLNFVHFVAKYDFIVLKLNYIFWSVTLALPPLPTRNASSSQQAALSLSLPPQPRKAGNIGSKLAALSLVLTHSHLLTDSVAD